jgi:hypothetical protein
MKSNPGLPGGSLMSKPTWSNTSRCSATSAFLISGAAAPAPTLRKMSGRPPTRPAKPWMYYSRNNQYRNFLGMSTALFIKVKAIMNEANESVRETARDVVVEILCATGIKRQEIESYFGEGSAGAALELQLTRFAGAILDQVKPKPLPKVLA